MKIKRAGWISIVLIFMIMAGGCAMKQPVRQSSTFQVQPLVREMWTQKADNLVIVLDASSSMSQKYSGYQKFDIGRTVVARFNKTMPDLAIKFALHSFGHSLTYSYKSTVPVYGLSDYSRSGVDSALASIVPAGGPSPMEKALEAVAADLKNAQGKIAMVIVSDGQEMGKAPLEAAMDLRTQYGDRLCIYTVTIGSDAAGRSLLSKISNVTGCGQAFTAEDVDTGPAMADFVTTVLLEKAESWIFKDINFESDQDVLMDSSYPTLEKIVSIMRDNPEISVEIQGHTDSTASNDHNLDLSQRRAQTVMNHLQSNGIPESRMTARGYGEDSPIDTNDTEEGKANNRRVELKPIK